MAKKKNYLDEYDADNYIYQQDDMEDDDEEIVDESEDDDLDSVLDDDNESDSEDFEGTDLLDLPGKKVFDPNDYDFVKIMEDYHSGNDAKRDKAIEQAVYAMDALVKFVIKRNYPTYRQKYYEDMLQTGRMAVVQTLGGYVPGKCAPSSYFYTNIKHEIQVFVAEEVHKTTRHYAAMANKIRKAEHALSQIDGKEVHDDVAISVYTGLPLTTVIETRRQTAASEFVELNTNLDTDSPSNRDLNPAVAYWKEAQVRAIHNAVRRLNRVEAEVVTLMFGLDGGDPLNPPDIARRMKLKTEQVRKISQDACRKLSHDKRLKMELGTRDEFVIEKEKSSTDIPFVQVLFGKGENFFDDVEENEGTSHEIVDATTLFKPVHYDNEENE